MHTAEQICEALHIDHSQILNIYPYGSQVYGTASEDSDHDYVIVYKPALLPSGAFKDNAISSDDRKIQGTCYSRTGFIDAINNYQITALECIFLPEDQIIQKKWPFKMSKFDKNEFDKHIIKTASASWFNAMEAWRHKNVEQSQKNMYHAIRILRFGLHIKAVNTIDYKVAIRYKEIIYQPNKKYNPHNFYNLFMSLTDSLKNEIPVNV
jgi:hypothetical protein